MSSPDSTRVIVDVDMAECPYVSDFARYHWWRGVLRSRAEAVLMVLDVRGVPVPDDAQAHITSCADYDQLTAWLEHALTAGHVDEVFA